MEKEGHYRENSEFLDWSGPEIFEHYEVGRRVFRDLNRRMVGEVFEEHVLPGDKVLEIGSGIGELSNLVPEKYKDNFTFVEQSPALIAKHQKRQGKISAAAGDIYHLPIKDGGADVVVSFSVFDTLRNLEQAASETSRVLKPNGKFIHILDLQPNAHVMLLDLPQDAIPFPSYDQRGTSDSFFLVDKNDYRQLREKLSYNPPAQQLLDIYVENPMDSFHQFHISGHEDILKHISSLVEKSGVPTTKTKTLNENFREKMLDTFENEGFERIFADTKSAMQPVQRSLLPPGWQNVDYVENDVGKMTGTTRPPIHNPETVLAKSSLDIIIEKKLANE